MADVPALRVALLELHRVLLQVQRVEAERLGGRMTPGELLVAAADDELRFGWLRELSGLIGALDHARAEDDATAVELAVERARALLDPPDPGTTFGARYLRALQEEPAVAPAQRDVTAALR